MKSLKSVLAVTVLVVACGGPGQQAARSPSPQASPSTTASAPPAASPATVEGPFGVLITAPYAATYTVSVFGLDGKVVASAQATGLPSLTCAGVASAVQPIPISISNSRVYFMSAQGGIQFLTPTGQTGHATSIPIGATRRSTFAVSPDDKRIAVVVADYTTASTASLRIYVEDLIGGGHHVQIYTQTATTGLWAAGWHGGSLILAKGPACINGGGPFCCGPIEYHLVDPATAVRRFTVGGSSCRLAGPPSPAGVVCEDGTLTHAIVKDWTNVTRRTFTIQGPTPALVSPDGKLVALVAGSDTHFDALPRTFAGLLTCGWIDDDHVFAGGDAQLQPRIGVVSTGAVIPIPAQGDCAGRIPGGL